ncbi:MAG: glycerol-3-phosphate dehydrogenase, partial [Alphaproteobacteria bacterium]|nr:glycerol-3-phosphate dehydrogenase [Alphaproteobacteria bacterium]
TRDYVLKLDHPAGGAPLLSVFGGKITTFRKLAEAALEKIEPFFPGTGKPWTANASLPGGDLAYAEVDAYIAELTRKYSFMTPRNVRRMFRAYGTEAEKIFDDARFAQDMGESFGLLTEREIAWLRTEEWAQTADDILWRRSKLGLHLSQDEQDALRNYFNPKQKSKSRRKVEG